ncbi:MAG: DUF3180 domain-containing protein, partial [Actinomycetota bacterium]|nr:DUF3180 domain-containing protein [Actinomycetota bacterium]
MRPTRAGVLLGLAAGMALLCYAVLGLTRAVLPPVPWTIPVALGVVGLWVALAAVTFRRRLHGAPGARPLDPLGAA